jgi:hypothetical protein|nr:MAG TPA: hypothetical protein [Caudoviricetes sp.]
MNKRDINGIHETVISDLGKLFEKFDGIDIIKKTFGSNKGNINSASSIAKAASNLVLTFPVLVDESVSLNTAQILTRAIEGKALVMLQLLFSAISVQSLKDDETAFDVIGKIHKNLNSDDIEDYIQRMETMATNESYEALDHLMKTIREENIAIDTYTFNESYPAPIDEDANTKSMNDVKNRTTGGFVADIKDTDIKKVNNMMPSVLVVKLHNKNSQITTNVAVGVKAKIQYVPQDEVIYRISSKNKDKNMLFNFIRSTTREISFLKDFLFALDKAKLDAIKIQKSSNTVWKILERRAVRNRVRMFNNDGGYGGIVSLVISADTLATLNKEYDFKASISEVENLISQYNLLAFFVADDVNERATYLFDDASRQFTTVSYTALEKTDSKDYKKIINLLVGQR